MPVKVGKIRHVFDEKGVTSPQRKLLGIPHGPVDNFAHGQMAVRRAGQGAKVNHSNKSTIIFLSLKQSHLAIFLIVQNTQGSAVSCAGSSSVERVSKMDSTEAISSM